MLSSRDSWSRIYRARLSAGVRGRTEVTFEIDHIFFCAEPGAPEADQLVELGLSEGRGSTHSGQGTSSRHFFFENAHLEAIWLHNDEEALSEATARTRLYERWHRRKSGVCPFGFCVRRGDPSAPLPFQGWRYAPRYLPKAWSIHIAGNSEDLNEPMLFCIPEAVRPDRFPEAYRQPLRHEIGFLEITRLRWVRPTSAPLSPELASIVSSGLITADCGSSHALEIGFDHELQGKRASLPTLPISIFW